MPVLQYANENIVNWTAALTDCYRVAEDLGSLRFQFCCLHRPLFGWKGSYVVSKMGAERRITFDHGPDGSIAEDCFFSMIADRDGHTFDFIEGEMREKSAFTVFDFLQQRKRWFNGILLTVLSPKIPWRSKVFLSLSLCTWLLLPLTSLSVLLSNLCQVPTYWLLDFLSAYIWAVGLYMHMFGALKSFAPRYQHRPWLFVLYAAGGLLAMPVNICIQNIAAVCGIFSRKYQFFVVKKE